MMFLPSSVSAQSQDETEQDWENMFTEISGEYSDPESRYEIEFPAGWSGVEFIGFPVVVPGDFKEADSEFEAGMMIFAFPHSGFNTAFWSSENIERIHQGENNHCIVKTYSYTKVNEMDGIHLIVECDSPQFTKVNMYGFMSDKDIVMAFFLSNSTSGYNEYVDAFEQSIITLKVNDHVSFKDAMKEVYDLREETYSVSAKDTQAKVGIETNSKISNFDFSENEKRVSFSIDGNPGANGLTVVHVDSVLEGPFIVTIDGEETDSFVVAQDESSGQSTIEISYAGSPRDIVIVGTNVVPEFPVPIVGAIAGLIGIAAIIGRGKYFKL
jgi:hypothetical protein